MTVRAKQVITNSFSHIFIFDESLIYRTTTHILPVHSLGASIYSCKVVCSIMGLHNDNISRCTISRRILSLVLSENMCVCVCVCISPLFCMIVLYIFMYVGFCVLGCHRGAICNVIAIESAIPSVYCLVC